MRFTDAARRLLMFAIVLTSTNVTFGQVRFQAEYLFFNRDSNGDLGEVISGPNSVSASDFDFGYQSAYRFAFGMVLRNVVEVEAVFARIDGWNASQSGVLVDALTFDDTVNNAFYGGTPPHNRFAFANALYHAATNNDPFNDLSGTDDETTEAEFLLPLSTYSFVYQSELDDFELNAKSVFNNSWYRFGVGYRKIELNEMSQLTVMGVFDTVDSATGLEAAPNNQLSHQALIAAGLTLQSGAADGWDDENAAPGGGPDTLILVNSANVENRMNGIQLTLDVAVLEGEMFLLDLFAKAGVYHNRVSGSVTESYTGFANDDSRYGRSFSDSRSTVAFAGNLGMRGKYPLTNTIRIIGAYEALFLTGVALAPDQYLGVSNNGPDARYSVYADGQVIAHGGSFGLEWTY